MKRLRSALEDVAVVICGSVIVILLCAMYWIGRLCGVDLNNDF